MRLMILRLYTKGLWARVESTAVTDIWVMIIRLQTCQLNGQLNSEPVIKESPA